MVLVVTHTQTLYSINYINYKQYKEIGKHTLTGTSTPHTHTHSHTHDVDGKEEGDGGMEGKEG